MANDNTDLPMRATVGEPGVPLMIEPDEELLGKRAPRDYLSGDVTDGDLRALNARLQEIRRRAAVVGAEEAAVLQRGAALTEDVLRRGGEEIAYAPGKPL